MNQLIIHTDSGKGRINRHIYGHFAEHLGRCFYDGIWVGEESPIPNTRGIRSDIVTALRRINIPNLRWPGGCFADDYHWQDGIGPKDQRPRTINIHWGNVIETNHFGTHEFLDLCEQLQCEPYISGNVGTGTAQEMRDWVEYLTFDGDSRLANLRRQNGREKPWPIKFWGIGNENWGCGGDMRPEYYLDEYRRYQTYIRNFGETPLYKIASGMGGGDYHSTEVLMKDAVNRHGRYLMDAISLHYYTRDVRNSDYSATKFGEREWFTILQKALEIGTVLEKHIEIMDTYDPEKQVGLIVDEWGTWYHVEPGTHPSFLYQQNSLRDALVAGVTLHIFHQHCDRIFMANIAQTVNVLQALILTEGEKMLLTPTYHVFDMYKDHQDAVLLPIDLQCESYTMGEQAIPVLSVSASRNPAGHICLTLCNLNPDKSIALDCVLRGTNISQATGQVLTAETMTAHNTFYQPEAIHPVAFDNVTFHDEALTIHLPAKSIVALTCQ